MAAIPCALKVPDTSSVGISHKVSLNKDRASILHRPYELSDDVEREKLPSSPVANVITTLSQKETMNLIYSNTFQKSPATLFPYGKAPFGESYDRIRQEELRTLAPLHANGFHDTKNNIKSGYLNGNRSPPPLEKIARRKADDSVFLDSNNVRHSPRVFDYNWAASEKMFETTAAYDALLKSSYVGKYEELSKRLGKYSPYDSTHYRTRVSQDDLPPPPSPSTTEESKHLVRSPNKARMKYTPMRDSHRYGEHPANSESPKLYPEFSPSPIVSSSAESSTSFPSRTHNEDVKPYYRSSLHETDLLRSMNLHSAAASQYDIDHNLKNIKSEYEKYNRRLSESFTDAIPNGGRGVNSAFSVIRPHFHRMYSTESGYSSEPSSGRIFKPYQSFEKSEILSRRHFNSVPEKLSAEAKFKDYSKGPHHHQQPEYGLKNIDRDSAVSKLHVSDEASKETLKAFDEHVQKMMAETSRKQNLNSPTQLLKLQNEMMMSASTNHVVQCSTVDSTQKTSTATVELTHGVGGLLGLTRIANEHLGQAIAKEKKRSKNNNCLHLWQFLRSVLEQEKDQPNKCIEWTNRERGEFRLIKTAVIADLWGQSKNRKCMTYEKMARAMRYYYKMKILEKVPHKRLHFRFGEKMLARVLDTNTVKPIRRMSTGDQLGGIRVNKGGYFNAGPPPPLQMLRRSSVDGINSPGVISFPSRMSQSDCPPTPMTPLTPLTPCTPMTPLTPCTPGINRTPVICSRTTNVFFPPDVPLSLPLSTTESVTNNNTEHDKFGRPVTTKSPENIRVATITPTKIKDEETSDISATSESDAELVVDMD